MLRLAQEGLRKQDNTALAKNTIMGATPEQQLASKETTRKAYSDSVANLASNASKLRDANLRFGQQQNDLYYKQRLGMQNELASLDSNMSNQWSTAGNNAFNLGGTLLGYGLSDINKSNMPSADGLYLGRALPAVGSVTVSGGPYINSELAKVSSIQVPSPVVY